ncbi:MAG: A24 family peptidase [Firmicutes bacterium]|nr:A24 family peptidase [Bacillota bacterium]
MIYGLVGFGVGLVVGSFLNVCIYRLPAGKSIVFPGSACPACGAALGVQDLVPVLSFIWLRGRCRRCGKPISIQYPLVELMTGIMFAVIAAAYGLTTGSLIVAVFACLLTVAAWTDLNTGLIPDRVTLPGLGAGLALSLISPDLTLPGAVAGALISGGVVYLIAVLSRGGMGGGDVKLMAMIGAFLGWRSGLLTLFLGALIGSVVGVTRIALGMQKRREPMPFGPYLALGAVVTIFIGETLLRFLGWT